MLTALGLAFLAGLVSILSPCVLPLLPLVFGTAASAHRFGAVALAGGLVLAFVAVGLFVATIGFQIGLDGELFRDASAAMLGLFGLLLLSNRLHDRLALAASGWSNRGNRLASALSLGGLPGQVLMGLLLGAIWSPCVGPTLGAASLLAAQGRDLGTVAATMAAFGIGTAIPLQRQAGARRREPARRRRHPHRRRSSVGNLAGHRLAGLADRPHHTLLSPRWLTSAPSSSSAPGRPQSTAAARQSRAPAS